MEVYDGDGGPILDLFDSGLTFEIPPLGSQVLRSLGTGEIRRGWIQVRTGTAWVSGLLTYKQGTTGIEVSVEPAELGDRFALFVEESSDVGAGVAVFKPEAGTLPSSSESGTKRGTTRWRGRSFPGETFTNWLARASGMVCRGRDRQGIPERLSGAPVPAIRGRIPVRPAGAAVREEEPFALLGSRNRRPDASSAGDDSSSAGEGPVLPGLRGWKRMVRAVGAQQRRRGDGRRGRRGSFRPERTADSGSVRFRIGVRDPGAGQPGPEERGRGGDPARMDQGRVRSGVGQWVVDLPGRPRRESRSA